MVKNVNCQILRDGVEMRRRWAEFFEHFLNVEDVRVAIGGCLCWVNLMKDPYR